MTDLISKGALDSNGKVKLISVATERAMVGAKQNVFRSAMIRWDSFVAQGSPNF